MVPLATVVAWLIFVGARPVNSSTAAAEKEDLRHDDKRRVQGFQFSGTSQFGQSNAIPTISPAPTTSATPIHLAMELDVARRIKRGHISFAAAKTESLVAGTTCHNPASISVSN